MILILQSQRKKSKVLILKRTKSNLSRRIRFQVSYQFSEACAIDVNQLVKHDLKNELKCVKIESQENFAITNLLIILSCLISSFVSALLSISETYSNLREVLYLFMRLKLHDLWQKDNTDEVKFETLNRS